MKKALLGSVSSSVSGDGLTEPLDLQI